MKCYVVIGHCGEYSDRAEWVVAVYATAGGAEKHAAAAEARAAELSRWECPECGYAYRSHWRSVCPKPVNQYDVAMRDDYTGTSYVVEESELFEAFEERKP
jgi:rubredoxin